MISAAKTTQHSERHVEILMDSAMGKTAEYRRKTQFFSGFARRIYIQQEAIWRGGARKTGACSDPSFCIRDNAKVRTQLETCSKLWSNSPHVRNFGPTRPTFDSMMIRNSMVDLGVRSDEYTCLYLYSSSSGGSLNFFFSYAGICIGKEFDFRKSVDSVLISGY